MVRISKTHFRDSSWHFKTLRMKKKMIVRYERAADAFMFMSCVFCLKIWQLLSSSSFVLLKPKKAATDHQQRLLKIMLEFERR